MRHSKFLLAACLLAACGKRAEAPEPRFDPQPIEQRASQTERETAGADAGAGSEPLALLDASTTDASAASDAGQWVQFARRNDVPLCVFPDYEQLDKVEFFRDAPKATTFRANERVLFSVFGPGCASQACIRRPTLQCWAEVEGNDIKLESRYSGEQRVGAKCKTDCEVVQADCETLSLPPGTYTIHYAGKKTKLKLPGTLRPACIRGE